MSSLMTTHSRRQDLNLALKKVFFSSILPEFKLENQGENM